MYIFYYKFSFCYNLYFKGKKLREITKYYQDKNIIFKDFNDIEPKEINSRKKIKIYCGTTVSKDYYAIFIVDAKSRFIRKNANDLIDLCEVLAKYLDHNFKKKELLISSPLCSKAKAFLKENGWSVRIDFM